MKKKLAVRILIWVLFAVFLAVFLYSGYRILSYYGEKSKAGDVYNGLLDDFSMPTKRPKPTKGSDESEESTEPTEPPYEQLVDSAAIAAQYPDYRGWLYCEDTKINYPVLQASNNDAYLYHLMDGSYNNNGSLFIDYRCAPGFGDDNTIIYGHNMHSGYMFGELQKYKDPAYYAEHPILYFETEYGVYRLDVIAAYTTPYDSEAYTISFASREDFLKYIETARAATLSEAGFASEVQVGENDRIATLSTCAYEFANARYVLVCRVSERMDYDPIPES